MTEINYNLNLKRKKFYFIDYNIKVSIKNIV